MPAMRLEGANVSRRGPLGPFRHIELYLLALRQGLEALALNRRVVAEDILLAVVASDEAIAFFVVEPLHCSSRTQWDRPS